MLSPAPVAPAASPRGRRVQHADACKHCGSTHTEGHGSFTRKDGSRQRRRLCRSCGRTYNDFTGTPLHYIKLRDRWFPMARAMGRGLSIRRTAAAVGIRVPTAFRWRHRLLGALRDRPQPLMTGSVAASETYVRYSEKGSRRTAGPGSVRTTKLPVPVFRRVRDGKPSCVLLATGEMGAVALAVVGQGRPTPEELAACLAQVLGIGAEVRASGLAPYARACLCMGIPHIHEVFPWAAHPVEKLRRHLYSWLARFHGVATRYLPNYLCWFRFVTKNVSLPTL
ncbi:MAG TPA: IS1595 family transposase [Symbiobacteriaceae bacterium]|nr:IS1595 family transposase [Symbiobacteriaceae bacterium]